ncbi:MAG: hypothetical protein KDD78_19085, partial [Caldilineaceae bacterium]|nr:hypothetical protein [Caldilineaceae bacterium]
MSVYAFLDLHLLTPVLVTGPGGGDPNSEITLTYIPGSVVRGLFAGRYGGPKDAGADEFRRLFLDGSVRYLNGYLVHDGQRTLPAPASWQMVKDGDTEGEVTVYDLAQFDVADKKV